MGKLTIITEITVKKSKIAEVRTELSKLIEPTRSEAGCLDYVLHQDNEDPTHFVFVEHWESREPWQKHLKSLHLKDIFNGIEGDIESLEVSELSEVV